MPQSKSNRVPCQMCGVEFGKAKYLSQHMLIHEGKTFACSMCSKTFSSRIRLNGHKYIHTEETVTCTVCNGSFLKSRLKAHSIIHSPARPFPCLLCEKAFKRKEGLRKHSINLHSGKDKSQCQVCQKSFTEEGLKRHKRVHSDGRSFACSSCHKKFQSQDFLSKHFERIHCHHKAEKFPCKLCRKLFTTESLLENHVCAAKFNCMGE